ncbi:hypothetical protein GGR22_000550 [Flavobacterium gossypii]|uniref:Uncharacterized protein n=1 Tax=Flavobacterium gossypii TaxID=1646119 RepID=A0ABR6DLR7_9FLAO|nr:hypothetical protein [Flavobacterium gossypii]MBA9072424.1 hypothetical protein [Flavobacterium gossypii]
MKIEAHTISGTKIAEIISDTTIIETAEDGLDLLGNLYYQDFGTLYSMKRILLRAFLT